MLTTTTSQAFFVKNRPNFHFYNNSILVKATTMKESHQKLWNFQKTEIPTFGWKI
jgi:hypothetical protein